MQERLSEALKNGLIAGLFSAVVSVLLNYYVLPFPKSILANAFDHGIGGFFCGLVSAFIAVMIVTHPRQQRQPLPNLKGGTGYEPGE